MGEDQTASHNQRVLIIGSSGFLGRYTARGAASEFTVVEGNRTLGGRSDEVAIDILDQRSIASAFSRARPDIVVLMSAISDIDYCQQHPEDAWAVNFRAAGYVAEACSKTGARLVFASTGAVFDGHRHGYDEDSPVSPLSVYGETKAQAEKLILSLLPDSIVVRLALVIGFALPPAANAILDKLRQKWDRGEPVAFPTFEYRNAIDAQTCSSFIVELIKNQERGIFHIGSSDSISRYDLGLKLAERMGFSNCVTPQREAIPGRAPRGPDHFLRTDKLRSACALSIPNCNEVIERCFYDIASR